MMNSKTQIIATIGPASNDIEILKKMLEIGVDLARLNLSWDNLDAHAEQIKIIRQAERESGKKIKIIIDLPGPRIQNKDGHTYDSSVVSSLTKQDEEFIAFGVRQNVEYIALSFVGGAVDVLHCKKIIADLNGKQKVIAKIERTEALKNLDEIISATDAIMVARGDLGNEVPLEQIPFVQEEIVKKAKSAKKPVIVATQMLLSMVENREPTRAEVTDVENAVMQGADGVMLSEETAMGKYPKEAVEMMEKIIIETEKHGNNKEEINAL